VTVVRAHKRDARKEDKRTRLRDAAWHLFKTKGYEATTTKEIAARAGVASGTLFLYARDKADLLFLVLHERLRDAVDEGLRTLPDAPLLDQLMHLFTGFFRVYAEAPNVARAFVKELPGADGPNAQQTNALTMSLLSHMGGLVQRAQANGEIANDVPPILLAQNAFALYFFALIAWLGNVTTLEGLDGILRASLALQLRGLGPKR
jgi:TetR/AcrR family transcriptional regulator, cholesterol catabolism regulator